MRDAETQVAATPDRPLSPAYAWYGLFILVIAYTVSFVDRTILTLLVQPIQRDLFLNDFEISLLHGFAFAIFYTLLGIPIARLADRASRKRIITVGIVIWSIMTATCGLAARFWYLFLSRIGVGVGEAALSPAAYSMISDMFPKEQHGRAFGFYSTGLYIGSGLAYIIGGSVINLVGSLGIQELPIVGPVKDWQLIFFLVGLPGLLVALLFLTTREPPRRGVVIKDPVPLAEVFKFMRMNWKTYSTHFVGFSMIGLVFNGLLSWTPTLFIRKFDYSAVEVGHVLGLSILIAGTLGIIFGGWMADNWVRRGHLNGPMRSGLVGALFATPLAVLAPYVADDGVAIALFSLFFFFVSIPYAGAAAALQAITPNAMRAQVSALFLFVLNMCGIGLGTSVVAFFTNYVFGDPAAVDQSMSVVGAIFGPFGVILLFLSLRPFTESARRGQAFYS